LTVGGLNDYDCSSTVPKGMDERKKLWCTRDQGVVLKRPTQQDLFNTLQSHFYLHYYIHNCHCRQGYTDLGKSFLKHSHPTASTPDAASISCTSSTEMMSYDSTKKQMTLYSRWSSAQSIMESSWEIAQLGRLEQRDRHCPGTTREGL